MKKILIVVLMIFVVGCAKKYAKPPAEELLPGEKMEMVEEILKPEKAEEEFVEEKLKMEEGEIKEFAMAGEAANILEDILFDFDKYDIKPDARAILDSIASWLKENNDLNIIIEGHCDERGTNEYNLALGERRAKAARDYLGSLGITSMRMSLITYGEEKPVCTEHNEDCWQKNRRAHSVITK